MLQYSTMIIRDDAQPDNAVLNLEHAPSGYREWVRLLLNIVSILLFFSAFILFIFNVSGIFPRSNTVEYAEKLNADRTRYADGIIAAAESLSYQFYVNRDLNNLLYDFSLSTETYDVSKWNMPFSSFLEGMANTVSRSV